jgi:hypothetical protein
VMESAAAAYYIWPALGLFVLASVNQRKDRFQLTCLLAIALTVESNVDFTRTWLWWGVAVLGLVLLSASSAPFASVIEPAAPFFEDKFPLSHIAAAEERPRHSELVS